MTSKREVISTTNRQSWSSITKRKLNTSSSIALELKKNSWNVPTEEEIKPTESTRAAALFTGSYERTIINAIHRSLNPVKYQAHS